MASRQLNLQRVLSLFCVLLMVETVSGARGSLTEAHIGPQFSASGVNQTPMDDVSIQVGRGHQVQVYSSSQQIFPEHLLCARH